MRVQPAQQNDKAKPFLKWAGGKRQLLPELRKYVPAQFGRYFEPFVGAGALFFDLAPERAVLSDVNSRLMATYIAVRDDVGALIVELAALEARYKAAGDRKAFYLALRDAPPPYGNSVAAEMLFLNRTCFNGLYRVNKAGKFNVPFGDHKDPTICDAQNLRRASLDLSSMQLRTGSFEFACTEAKAGDLVYFDPPYVPVTPTASFTAYTPNGFGLTQQVRLADLARDLKRRGVHVILTNSDTPVVRGLYASGFDLHPVSVRRAINSRGTQRGPVGELIIT